MAKSNSQHDLPKLASSRVYLGLGSNIQPRKRFLLKSIVALYQCYPNEFQVSKCYVTRPYMGINQSGYFNCCVCFKTDVTPEEILISIQQIEHELGRNRDGRKWASRVIDIDILFFGQKLIETTDLIIPHYDVSNRDFFLIPMLDLEETFINPRTNLPIVTELHLIPRKIRTFPKTIEMEKRCAFNTVNPDSGRPDVLLAEPHPDGLK